MGTIPYNTLKAVWAKEHVLQSCPGHAITAKKTLFVGSPKGMDRGNSGTIDRPGWYRFGCVGVFIVGYFYVVDFHGQALRAAG